MELPSLLHLYKAAFFDYLVIGLCWLLILKFSVYLYPIWSLIIAGRLHAFGVIIHDLSHSNLKKKNVLTRILEISCGYIIGTSVNAMAYHHLRHHSYTLQNNDPYFNLNKKCTGMKRLFLTFKKGPFFTLFWVTRSFFAPFALLFPKARNFYGRFFLQDVSGEDLTYSRELRTCMIEDIPIAVFHSLLLWLTISKVPFLIFGYYFIAPAAGVLCIYRLLIEHEYEILENKNDYAMMETTFDHHLTFFGKMLVGPHNIGFHCIHHLHPNIGFHALPKVRNWYLERSQHYLKNQRPR